ncbi:MAG: methyltransferase domain-containing protein [bacterium]|nr:methyltransferase domain-containing protein [bacterium]
MENKDLKKIYEKAYKKGENKHFTNLIEGLHSEEREILNATQWKGKKVLDVGCGTGLFVHEAAKRGAFVIGLDYVPQAIEIAKRTHKHPNIEFRCEDIHKTINKYKGRKFDVVVSVGTVEHLDKPFAMLKLFKQIVKPRGEIIFTCPNWINPRGLILQTMRYLFDAPITLADLHYFSPRIFERWAAKNKLQLRWKTFDTSWGAGDMLLRDLKRRLPNVLRDMGLKNDRGIKNFLKWLKDEALQVPWTGKYVGVNTLYHVKKK